MNEAIKQINLSVNKSNLENDDEFFKLKKILENLDCNQIAELKKNHTKPDKGYSRNRYCINDLFELVLICWAPKASSSIHNHGSSSCFYRILSSSIDEIRYNKLDDIISKEHSHIKHRENSISYINDSIGVHQMINTSNDEYGYSIHLYSPPLSNINVYN